MISVLEQGVGAAAEEKIKAIAPLVKCFETEMGVGAGRLMLATNFLRDARKVQPALIPEARAVSSMIRLLGTRQEETEGYGCEEGCGCIEDIKQQAQAWLEKAKNRS